MAFTISKASLAAPQNLSLTSKAPGMATATWDTVENASGYTVHLCKDGEADVNPITTTGTSCDFSIAEAGSYTVKVKANGDSNHSDSAEATSDSLAFYAVTVNGSYAQTGGAGVYAEGAAVSIDAGTRAGYTFDGWTSSDGVKFENEDRAQTTFIMPGTSVTVTASWKQNAGGGSYDCYTISASAGEGGSISPSGNISVREGRDKTFTITPDGGYRISDVRVDGVSVGAVSSYTFDNVQKRHTIEAFFAKENPDAGNPFTDVHPDDWFYDDVMLAYQNGLMNGTSAATFSPDDPITRAQAAAIFYRMAGSPEVAGDSAFTDVTRGPGTAWYYNAVLWAQQNGIVSGYGDGTFRPEAHITREQLAVIFYNYAKLQGYGMSAAHDLSGFTDAGAVSSWALPAMRWAVGRGIISGHGDGVLGPQGTATRAQMAAMLL